MYELIENIGKSQFYTGLATIFTIISFILSIFIILLARKIKGRLQSYSNIRDFNSNRQYFYNNLIGYRDLILKDNIFDEKLLNDILIEVQKYYQLKSILTFTDKRKIKKLNKMISARKIDKIDRNKLLSIIAYFIGRFSLNREEF